MAKKARQRISYVLELPNSSPGGHRLGVNGLAVDRDNAILYSGGRDGVICAWDLNKNATGLGSHSAVVDPSPANGRTKSITTFRAQTQAHTHWINDIALAQNHTALVSASSDLLVKVWRPHASDITEPVTIGQHADYVKCLATPSQSTNWVASGGLDRKIYLWDLSGAGKTLEIDVQGEEVSEKGSIYALGATHDILANGGPESTVRLWDPRSGKRITKFVGHTDMVRAILISESGDMVLSASADQTVKVWSVTAGRCMHTLTMHDQSVWALFSDDPGLNIFYSSDRSGLVVKTDVRDTKGDLDNGLSLAVAKENDGVSKIVAWDDSIWTATARASINRWRDVDTSDNLQLPEVYRQHRSSRSLATIRSKESVAHTAGKGDATKTTIPPKSILRISNTASFPLVIGRDADDAFPPLVRSASDPFNEPAGNSVEPVRHLPDETIEGQFGLVKHRLLNDRRRVLTLDTAGDVLMWDLIQCRPVKSFGKRHLEDVEPEVNTREAVAPWCSIDISSGNLTVVLEPYNCFDAEMYADELLLEEPVEFREDQRINLGKWVLRYLFANLIDEEIKRDETFRQKLNEGAAKRLTGKMGRPLVISIPSYPNWSPNDPSSATPRAGGSQYPPMTPGLGIGLATPGSPFPHAPDGTTPLSPLDKRLSHVSRPSQEREDYFSDSIQSPDGTPKPAQTPAPEVPPADDKTAKASGENGKDKEKDAKDKDKDRDKDKDKENAKSPTTFGKKFRMGMSFGTKKLGRSLSTAAAEKPAVVDEKAEESESSSNHEKDFEDSFLGVVQRLRSEYEKQLTDSPDQLVETKLAPSLTADTPVLKLPAGTKVIIQEETSGGSAEIYRGTVASVGADADVIEERGPQWLGEVLLLNALPPKDPVKISFVLYPWKDALPPIVSADGNNRLNANRMLRVKKILAYVAERIDPVPEGEEPAADALRPEEYLELYCNDQLLPIKMSLATLRTHIWRGGNDVVLHYKANGRKEIPMPPPAEVEEAEQAETAATGA